MGGDGGGGGGGGEVRGQEHGYLQRHSTIMAWHFLKTNEQLLLQNIM
jgi:hypothetical protein